MVARWIPARLRRRLTDPDPRHPRSGHRKDGRHPDPAGDGSEFPFRLVAWSPDGESILGIAGSSDRGSALVSFSTDGPSVEVLTPWSWAFEFTSTDDITWQPSTDGG